MAVVAAIALGFAASVRGCGESPVIPDQTLTPVTSTADRTRTPLATPSQQEPITELRVAYINLMSPISLDANDTTAADTFEQRMEMLIEELKAFKPDIVAFSEAAWTKETGYASERLVAGLRMEPYFVRSNPWFPGQSREDSEALVKLQGFEEGELVLVRSPFTILEGKRQPLNPRTSESEGRVALHLAVGAPPPLERIDVYVTHLTGGDERLRTLQAESLVSFVESTRGNGPAVIMADLSSTPESLVAATISNAGFVDVFSAFEVPAAPDGTTTVEVESPEATATEEQTATPIPGDGDDGESEPSPTVAPSDISFVTCCRSTVLGEQPPLTVRTDFIFSYGLLPPALAVFGSEPKTRADGMPIYISDHNGLQAVFPIGGEPFDPNLAFHDR